MPSSAASRMGPPPSSSSSATSSSSAGRGEVITVEEAAASTGKDTDTSPTKEASASTTGANNKGRRKKLRPKLKPMPSPSNDDYLNVRSPLDELGFGNFVTTKTTTTTDGDEKNDVITDEEAAGTGGKDTNNTSTEKASTTTGANNTKDKKKKLRPKLKPMPSPSDDLNSRSPLDELGFGNFVTTTTTSSSANDGGKKHDVANRDASSSAAIAESSSPNAVPNAQNTAATPPHVEAQPRTKKIQPQLFSPDESPGDDMYAAFGFGLVRADHPTGGTTTTGARGGGSDGEEEAEATTYDALDSLVARVASSPLTTLRRCRSPESYVSDDSSATSGGHGPGRLYIHRHRQQTTTTKAEEDALEDGTAATASTAAQSEGDGDLHSLFDPPYSYQQGFGMGIAEASSFGSDDSSSHFGSQWASPPRGGGRVVDGRLASSYPIPPGPRLPGDAAAEYDPRGGSSLLPRASVRPPWSHIRSNSAPHIRSPLELKLSLSEEGSNSNDGTTPTPTSTRGHPSAVATPPSRGASSSSGDDRAIANELSSYSRRRTSSSSSSGGGPPSHSDSPPGRLAPVDDAPVPTFHATLALAAGVSSSSDGSAIEARRPLARQAPHHRGDQSFLADLRGSWREGGRGAVGISSSSTTTRGGGVDGLIGSPRGAFEREQRPSASSAEGVGGGKRGDPPILVGVGPPAGPRATPRRLGWATPSLAYSDDEDDNARFVGGRGDDRHEADEGAAAVARRQLDDVTRPTIYPSRWIMLAYVSVLNLLGGWSCYGIAPISGPSATVLDVDPEGLVSIFFAASAFGSVVEPAILRRLGLRRTVLLGALLLMTGNMLRCVGGRSASSEIDDSDRRWYLYFGSVLAGSSVPLYRSTPALLITSWFPQRERRAAADMAMYSNQLGIGCSFFFGGWFVRTSDDLFRYFHFLGVVSTVAFVGASMQFSDCPPTPPSGTARVIRGALERPIFVVDQHNEVHHGAATSGGNDRSKVALRLPSAGSLESIGNTPAFSVSEYSTIDMAPGGPAGHAVADEAISEYIPIARGAADNKASTRQSYGSTGSLFTKSERNDDVSAMSSPFPNLQSADEAPRGTIRFQPWLEFYSFSFGRGNFRPEDHLPPSRDDGAELIMTQTPRHLDIDICDDQIWRSLRACFGQKGFPQCVAAYAISGIVMNTIAAFMYYLVTLNGVGIECVGIVGGAFQLTAVISSVVCRRLLDGSQRFYMNIIALLAISAFTVALCAANLVSGMRLWLNLLLVAVCVCPLQSLSTGLG